ncbi:MAG TPA: bifunctional phosphoribosylaminoimidazolecarboxamide formyltransferase/IMP cyclohydrolase [Flavisolibacter sp.]|jgi:phosphoribosylaminoimidazolecarboxamide formyltransferase/IMP cyclohydrolase|nr:bifunctional phosphoribosylaminoimidazolecarboxamide formyltransferase/IMP cyclohydrolase [Flavisolibacter sp.]
MSKKITSALISVFYKDGLEPLVRELHNQEITIYSTGGTQNFIENLNIEVVPVEDLTSYPSILGGRVKTLHPSVFGGILGRRNNPQDLQEMKDYQIPVIDLVIVDLYPFQETVASTTDEKLIIEKIDIGGPSMIRAAAKNFNDVAVIASKDDYLKLVELLRTQDGTLTLDQRRDFAAKAFQIVADYDIAINNYFNKANSINVIGAGKETVLRYGENPHQKAVFYGDLNECFSQLHGKEISYNNLVDIDAAIELIKEFDQTTFAIIKHTNVCGIAMREEVAEAWKYALAGDPESAFGGVLVSNAKIDVATAQAINEIFFEVLIAPSFDEEALQILKSKKNRILLQLKNTNIAANIYKNAVNGTLQQGKDAGNFEKWEEVGGRQSDEREKEDLIFANIVCKHLKSNAIALIKNKQLVGKGCGQTSRVDATRQAIEKAKQFNFDLNGAVLASDAFFPFNDSVQIAHEAGVTAFIQPGGSIRDKDSIDYAVANNLAMVMTGVRHFKH